MAVVGRPPSLLAFGKAARELPTGDFAGFRLYGFVTHANSKGAEAFSLIYGHLSAATLPSPQNSPPS